jgi:hypothetical protein
MDQASSMRTATPRAVLGLYHGDVDGMYGPATERAFDAHCSPMRSRASASNLPNGRGWTRACLSARRSPSCRLSPQLLSRPPRHDRGCRHRILEAHPGWRDELNISAAGLSERWRTVVRPCGRHLRRSAPARTSRSSAMSCGRSTGRKFGVGRPADARRLSWYGNARAAAM